MNAWICTQWCVMLAVPLMKISSQIKNDLFTFTFLNILAKPSALEDLSRASRKWSLKCRQVWIIDCLKNHITLDQQVWDWGNIRWITTLVVNLRWTGFFIRFLVNKKWIAHSQFWASYQGQIIVTSNILSIAMFNK